MAPSVDMMKELALLSAAHAAASSVACRGVTGNARHTRTMLAAAAALYAVARRWTGPSRQIIAAVLLTKLLPLFEGPRRNVQSVAAIFVPVAAVMWCRWPDAVADLQKNTSVHPNFTGTMAALTGVGKEVRKFGAAPDTFLLPKQRVSFAETMPRSVVWSAKALGLVYTLQQFIGWCRTRGRRRGDDEQTPPPPTVPQRALTVATSVLRTVTIYTVLSQYSVWAYMRLGHRRGYHWSLPSTVFLLEPLPRAITLCEYYVSHWIYAMLSDFRKWAGPGPADWIQSAAAPAAVMAMYPAMGRKPPLYSVLRSITGKVAPPPRPKDAHGEL